MHVTKQRSILFVDDEQPYVDLMTSSLAANVGCEVRGFTRPQDALDALAEIDPAVIVTDYFMPQMDGLAFIRQAAIAAPNAVFILITGHRLDEVEEEIRRLKPLKARLQKPFGWRRLAEECVRIWPGGDLPRVSEQTIEPWRQATPDLPQP